MKTSQLLSRRTILALLWMLVIVGMFVGSYVFARPASTTDRITVLAALVAAVVSLLSYRQGYQWARYLLVVNMSLITGLLLPEPYVSQKLAISVFAGPAIALVLADAPWVVGSALLTYLCLLTRASWSGIYLEPLGAGSSIVLIGGMALARHLMDEALHRAEEQSRLLDIERFSLATRVAERTRDLAEANTQLRQANQMKDAFLASVSHELRTPLNVILGNAELMQERVYGVLTDRQEQSLSAVSESGNHLLKIINDILDLAKIEAGRFDFVYGAISVADLCTQCVRLMRDQADRKNLGLELQIDTAVGEMRSDPRRLQQILINLLHNAVKFTPEGGTIGLHVRLDDAAQSVEFVVWDTGIGIAEADQMRLFQPFSQVDNRLARRYEGVGIGLALVAQLVAHHGGTISVESALGAGSRFRVCLPVGVKEEIEVMR